MQATLTAHQITLAAPRAASPRDRGGWNRLSIFPTANLARCALRPITRQAALDAARGMVASSDPTAYAPCREGGKCATCPTASLAREPWNPTRHIREDSSGRVWVLGNLALGFSGRGYMYLDWADLFSSMELPALTSSVDATGRYWLAR